MTTTKKVNKLPTLNLKMKIGKPVNSDTIPPIPEGWAWGKYNPIVELANKLKTHQSLPVEFPSKKEAMCPAASLTKRGFKVMRRGNDIYVSKLDG